MSVENKLNTGISRRSFILAATGIGSLGLVGYELIQVGKNGEELERKVDALPTPSFTDEELDTARDKMNELKKYAGDVQNPNIDQSEHVVLDIDAGSYNADAEILRFDVMRTREINQIDDDLSGDNLGIALLGVAGFSASGLVYLGFKASNK